MELEQRVLREEEDEALADGAGAAEDAWAKPGLAVRLLAVCFVTASGAGSWARLSSWGVGVVARRAVMGVESPGERRRATYRTSWWAYAQP